MTRFCRFAGWGNVALLALAVGCQSPPDAASARTEELETKVSMLEQRMARVASEAAASTATANAASVDPTAVGAEALALNEEDTGPDLVPDGFSVTLEAEAMTLTGGMERVALPEVNGQGVLVKGNDGKAVGSIRLEPGIYRARLFMKRGADELHDAVNVVFGRSFRVYRAGEGVGPVEEFTPRFRVNRAHDVVVEIRAAEETGLVVDKVVLERYREAQ